MNILYEFSSALLQARQNKNVTQEQIAFALDISQVSIQKKVHTYHAVYQRLARECEPFFYAKTL